MIYFSDYFKMLTFRIVLLMVCLLSKCQLFSQYATEITVAQDGSGDFASIQSAINATKSFPDQTITIFIKKGTYREKVRVYPWNPNVTLIGQEKESTIVTFNDHYEKINLGRNSTFHTYTLSIEADKCTVKNLTISNTAGPVGQAIALSVAGDKISVIDCNILGHQDALYCTGNGHRQYYQDCFIEGTTDYIFGNATACFQDCTIRSLSILLLLPHLLKKNKNMVWFSGIVNLPLRKM